MSSNKKFVYGLAEGKEPFSLSYKKVYGDKYGGPRDFCNIWYPDLSKIPIPLNAICKVLSAGESYSSYKAMLLAHGYTLEEWASNGTYENIRNGESVITLNVAYHDDGRRLVYSVRKETSYRVHLIGQKGLLFVRSMDYLPKELFDI